VAVRLRKDTLDTFVGSLGFGQRTEPCLRSRSVRFWESQPQARMPRGEDCQNAKLRATCGNLGCRCKTLLINDLRQAESQECQVAKGRLGLWLSSASWEIALPVRYAASVR
jgi:hypothetical protein